MSSQAEPQASIEWGSSSSRRLTRREQFERFHAAHPEVYRELRRRAGVAVMRNVRVGVRALLESMRWSTLEIDGAKWWKDGKEFKINNNHQRFYRDLLRKESPELAAMFPVRGRTSS